MNSWSKIPAISVNKKMFSQFMVHPLISHSLVFFAGVLMIFSLYSPTWLKLVHKYLNSGTYAHGFLIFPISIGLIIQHRGRFSLQPLRYEPIGLAGLLILSMVWFAASLAFVGIIQQLAFVLMFIVLFITCYGLHTSWQFAFPLGFLLFAIPFGNFLTPTLQDFTARFTVIALELTGIPVFYEGWQISTAHGQFEVAEACSGIRYLIATLSLGLLYAYYTYQCYWKRVVFLLLCIALPLLANGIRAYTIIWIAHKSQMKYAVGVDHLIYGWIFFGLIIALLFYVGSLWRDKPTKIEPIGNVEGASKVYPVIMIPLLWVALVLGPFFSYMAQTPSLEGYHQSLSFAVGTKGWKGPSETHSDWKPDFRGPTLSRQATYVKDHLQVEVFVALYYHQTQDQELLTESNRFYRHENWALLDKALYAFKNNAIPTVVEYTVQNQKQKRIIWSWYNIAGIHTTSPIWGKVLEGYSIVRKANHPSVVIAISTPYEFYPEQGRSHLEDFIEDMGPIFMKELWQDD